MVASITCRPEEPVQLAELLSPDLRVNGTTPEQRLVVSDISWNRYRKIDAQFGDDRSAPRLYYLDGKLELMSTSEEHERIKEWIGDLLSDYFFEKQLDVMPRGQATLQLRQFGAEPDKSWCLGRNKKFPDLVLEVALSSGGLDKLEIYRRFRIPEVWIWRAGKLEIFALRRSGGHAPVEKSSLLPKLDISLLESCVQMPSWQQARKKFRASLAG